MSLLFLMMFVFGLLSILQFKRWNNNNENLKLSKYRLIEYDPKTDHSSIEIVTLFKEESKFSDNSILDHQIEEMDGKLFLLSKIDISNKDYKCTGICYCDTESRSTTSSSISSFSRKSFVFLVSALSTTIAIKQAKKYFEKKCKDDFSDSTTTTCLENTIQSEVDKCEFVYSDPYGEEFLEDALKGEFKYDYICNGYCVSSSSSSSNTEEEYCSNFGLTDEDVSIKDLKPILEYLPSKREHVAIIRFSKIHLEPICITHGCSSTDKNFNNPSLECTLSKK